MKKILSLAIVFLMIFTAFASSVPSGAADYAGNVSLSLTNAAGKQNEYITLDLTLDENPGLFGFWIMLYYDEDTFILDDITYNDDLLKDGEINESPNNVSLEQVKGPVADRVLEKFKDYNISTADKNYKIIFYENNSFSKDCTFTGTVATLKFQIMGIAEEGDYTIGIMPGGSGNCINCNGDDLYVTVTNSLVRVGSDKVPTETQKFDPADTLPPDQITEEPEPANIDNVESKTIDDSTMEIEVETIIGEDGKAYVTNDAGETELFEPEDVTAEPETGKDEVSTAPETEAETEAVTDVAGEVEKETKNTIDLFGMKIPLIYFAAAILLILIAIAAILFLIISKTRKSDREIGKEKEPEKEEKEEKENTDDTEE